MSTGIYLRKSPELRFWEKVNKQGPVINPKLGPCWLWTSTFSNGYGQFWFQNKYVGSHRYSFFLANKFWPLPECLHKCDNKKCVNPDHLEQGTKSKNSFDAYERELKQGFPKGDLHPGAKLTYEQVAEIRARYTENGNLWNHNGMNYVTLAKEYNISPTAISRIIRNISYCGKERTK